MGISSMEDQFIDGLTLNKSEQAYYERLLRHNWLYPLCDSLIEYRRFKKQEQRLKKVAQTKGNLYQVLYERVSLGLRKADRYNEVKHTFYKC